jgi:hypothetical protein
VLLKALACKSCTLLPMRLDLISSVMLLATLCPRLPSPPLTKTSFQVTAINISRESIFRVQWGESIRGCTLKDPLHRSAS